MITRMALFNGTLKPGAETAMRAHVEAHLAPLWRQFDGAQTVAVLYNTTPDPNGPPIPLILKVTYPDKEAIARAMASPARHTSRDLLPEFYEMFFQDVRLWHYEFSD